MIKVNEKIYPGADSTGNMKFGGMLVITHLEKFRPAMTFDDVPSLQFL